MAKLSARGRREWLRFRHVDGAEFAYMSDGSVLWKVYQGAWRRSGVYPLHRPLSEMRARHLEGNGWNEVKP